ncbi:MAG: XRE family transcriptional regulator [Bacteroidia bacterium]
MSKYETKELELLNIQIGFVLKLARLQKKISQENLGLAIDGDKTKIARLEKNAHATNWTTIYLVSQKLDIDFGSLFILKSKRDLLLIVDECIKLDNKLTTMKIRYYENLKRTISEY